MSKDKIDILVEQYPEVWKTRAEVFSWLKGIIRKGWNVAPQKIILMKKRRKQIPNPNPKGKKPTVWGATCEICLNDFPMSNLQIDHRDEETAHLTNLEDIQSCAEKLLLVVESDLRVVCKRCHSIHSYAQRMNISFEQATLEKKVVAFKKLSTEQQKEVLTNEVMCETISPNAKGRAEQYREWLYSQKECEK